MRIINSIWPKLICILAISSLIFGQALELRDLPNRKGIQAGYDSRKDETTVATKKIDTAGRLTGKSQKLDPNRNVLPVEENSFQMEMVAAFFFKGQKVTEPVKEIILVFMPRLPVLHGVVATRGLYNPEVEVPAETRAVATADGQRIDLGKIIEANRQIVPEQNNRDPFLSVSTETFKKIATSKKLRIMLGDIEINLTSRELERLRSLSDELDARQRKTPG